MNKTVLISLVVAVFCATFAAAKPEKQVVSLKSLGVDSEPRACNVGSCDSSCRNLGWVGGVCIGGDCYCWKYTYGAPAPVESKKSEVASLKSLGGQEDARACNFSECNNACKRKGWKGGFCSGGSCYCWR